MKEAYYFSHDSNSRNDSKIIQLRIKHGMRGYGIFWAIIEMLRDESGHKMRMECERIAFELHEESEVIKSVIQDFDLFIIKDGFFWSVSLLRRMKIRDEKSSKARKSALARWNKRFSNDPNANALQTESDSNAIKEKESKIKEKEIEIDDLDFSILDGIEEKKYIPTSYEDSSEAITLTKKLADFFSISEINQARHFMIIGNFVRYHDVKGNFNYVQKQCESYMELKKNVEPKYIHKWENFIGSPRESYQDGIWNKEDWSKKISGSSSINGNVLPSRKKTQRNV